MPSLALVLSTYLVADSLSIPHLSRTFRDKREDEQMVEACMRTPEAARYLGISQSTLNKTRLTGDGPHFVKVTPRAVAYRKVDLDAWLEARLCRSTSDRPMAA